MLKSSMSFKDHPNWKKGKRDNFKDSQPALYAQQYKIWPNTKYVCFSCISMTVSKVINFSCPKEELECYPLLTESSCHGMQVPLLVWNFRSRTGVHTTHRDRPVFRIHHSLKNSLKNLSNNLLSTKLLILPSRFYSKSL